MGRRLAAQISLLNFFVGQQVLSGIGQNDLTGLHNVATISSVQSDLGVLLNEQDGSTVLIDIGNSAEDLLGDQRSQTQRRLVQQKQSGCVPAQPSSEMMKGRASLP